MNGTVHTPKPVNEPVLSYAPGTPERDRVVAAAKAMAKETVDIPMVIGGDRVDAKETREAVMPHDHHHVLGRYAYGDTGHMGRAIDAALAARQDWARTPFHERAAIFLRAAELLSTTWRDRLNAATMLNQSKTVHQAEIDAACELIDFFRFNVHFAERILDEQPQSAKGIWNQTDYRPLDGFVLAVTPFNFTSIAGNLPTAPALMGNAVVWKPSLASMLSAHHLMALLEEAGLPPGVVNLVAGDPAALTDAALSHPDFGGLHFTGSTAVLKTLFKKIGERMDVYRQYPRVVGESGGKDFVFVHPSASGDLEAVATALVRGAFEYQGQKCSAASRAYVPASMWKALERRLVALTGEIRMGDVLDLSNFMAAVINETAFDRITGYLARANESKEATIVTGGGSDRKTGWFVEPTIVRVTNPKHELIVNEIFGPVLTVYVYEDAAFEETLELCDTSTAYGLTGAIFARDRAAVSLAAERLRFAAGNFYVNDKPTGAVVGQQPFGGSRGSGTNDKAGAMQNLLRWTSPRSIKETFSPPTSPWYAYQG